MLQKRQRLITEPLVCAVWFSMANIPFYYNGVEYLWLFIASMMYLLEAMARLPYFLRLYQIPTYMLLVSVARAGTVRICVVVALVYTFIHVYERDQHLIVWISASVVLLITIFYALTTTPTPRPTPPSSGRHNRRSTLRVMQYNIQSGCAMDGTYNLDRAATEMKKANADVICVQEIDRHCLIDCFKRPLPPARTASDQPAELARLLSSDGNDEWSYVFASKTTEFGGEYGNAILSRTPILESHTLHYTSWRHHGSSLFYGPLPQVALLARVRDNVWIVCTHLGCDASGLEQALEMEELYAFIHQHITPDPTTATTTTASLIVTGDFNSLPTCASVQLATTCWGLSDAWLSKGDASCGGGRTIPSAPFPHSRLDYILYTAHTMECVKCVVPSTTASDHLPVIATFEILCQ